MKISFRTKLARFVGLICTLIGLTASSFAAAAPSPLDFSDITKPEFFPILPWDPLHGWGKPFIDREKNGLESIADCHFNMAGFVMPRICRSAKSWDSEELLLLRMTP